MQDEAVQNPERMRGHPLQWCAARFGTLSTHAMFLRLPSPHLHLCLSLAELLQHRGRAGHLPLDLRRARRKCPQPLRVPRGRRRCRRRLLWAARRAVRRRGPLDGTWPQMSRSRAGARTAAAALGVKAARYLKLRTLWMAYGPRRFSSCGPPSPLLLPPVKLGIRH